MEIDKGRFPDIDQIDSLLTSAGFHRIQHFEVLVDSIPLDLEYINRVTKKFASTYYLLTQDEYEFGLKKLEAFIKSRNK